MLCGRHAWAWCLEDDWHRGHPRHPDLVARLLLVRLPPPPVADWLPTPTHQRLATSLRCPAAQLSHARAQIMQELERAAWRRESSPARMCAVGDTHFFDLGEGVWTLHRRPWRMRMTAWGESSEAMTSPPPPPRCSRSRASSPSDAPPPFSAHIGYVFGFADWN
jgi:hypothetical protein